MQPKLNKHKIKQAFSDIKQDISHLNQNLNQLNNTINNNIININNLNSQISEIVSSLNNLTNNTLKIANNQSKQSKSIYQISQQNKTLSNQLQKTNLLKLAISDIKNELKIIKQAISDLKTDQNNLEKIQKNLENNQKNTENILKSIINTQNKLISTQNHQNSTIRHIFPTYKKTSTHNLPLKALKPKNIHISTRNQGVSTDRQTDRQTDTRPEFINNLAQNEQKINSNELNLAQNQHFSQKYDENYENLIKIASRNFQPPQQLIHSPSKIKKFPEQNQIQKASEILENLDNLKKEIRLKFKRLTTQEFKVFSAIYQLEQEQKQVDYTLLSNKLKLSESSIRDYISRIIFKGIPIIKQKINNKQIILHISQD